MEEKGKEKILKKVNIFKEEKERAYSINSVITVRQKDVREAMFQYVKLCELIQDKEQISNIYRIIGIDKRDKLFHPLFRRSNGQYFDEKNIYMTYFFKDWNKRKEELSGDVTPMLCDYEDKFDSELYEFIDKKLEKCQEHFLENDYINI